MSGTEALRQYYASVPTYKSTAQISCREQSPKGWSRKEQRTFYLVSFICLFIYLFYF